MERADRSIASTRSTFGPGPPRGREFALEVAARGCRIEVNAADDSPASPFAADQEALARALVNLLDNAVKYSPDARTVWWTRGETATGFR